MARKSYTTHQVARYCDVEANTVINWIDKGRLNAYRTPGGHRRIKKQDFVSFLKEYNIPFPHGLEKENSRKILIIEDDRRVIEVITKIIQKLKPAYGISQALDGFEAGKQVLALHPDLVILDLMLPGIDGFKVCANIRNDEAIRDVKILAVTGYDSPENKRRILECGANAYLAKPFGAEELVTQIEHLLE